MARVAERSGISTGAVLRVGDIFAGTLDIAGES
jgi:hypothetical protein